MSKKQYQHQPLSAAQFHILLALSDGERHGYAIMQDVADSSAGKTKMGPGTLYGNLKKMIKSGWIEESEQRPDPALDDKRRRYYRLTALGKRVGEVEAQRLNTLVQAAREKRFLPEVSYVPIS